MDLLVVVGCFGIKELRKDIGSKKIILNCARRKYILCDSSKLGQSAVARVTELSDCDGLITMHSPAAENYASMTRLLYA